MLWMALVSALFVAHQVWGTNWSAQRGQNRLREEYLQSADRVADLAASLNAATTTTSPSPTTTALSSVVTIDSLPSATTTTTAPAPSPIDAALDAAIQRVVGAEPGDVIARLTIAAIDLDRYVVEGVGEDELRTGPGRYQGTSHLGERGNAAVAGHRTTYGAPFERIDELRPGDRISVETPVGIAEYEVMDPRDAFAEWLPRAHSVGPGSIVVSPDDNFVLGNTGDDRLTLTACTPKYSARQRIIVAARLVTPPFEMLEPPPGLSGAPPATDVAATVAPVAGGATETTTAVSVVPQVTSALAQAAESRTVADPTLRQGFDGLPAEVVPTVLLAMLLMLVIILATVIAGTHGRVIAGALGALPFLVVTWYFFEHLDRLLPAY